VNTQFGTANIQKNIYKWINNFKLNKIFFDY
jgi:hypothetical protein